MNLLLIKTLTDGTITRSILNYTTENEALSALYYELWYATSNDSGIASIVAEIITDYGNVTKCERYTAPTSKPIPAPVDVPVEESEVSA